MDEITGFQYPNVQSTEKIFPPYLSEMNMHIFGKRHSHCHLRRF